MRSRWRRNHLRFEDLEGRRLLTLNAPVELTANFDLSTQEGFRDPVVWDTSDDFLYWTDDARRAIWRYEAATDEVSQIEIPFGRATRWQTAITDDAFFFLTTETGCIGECSGGFGFESGDVIARSASSTFQAPRGDRNLWRIDHDEDQAIRLPFHETLGLHNDIFSWRSDSSDADGSSHHYWNVDSSEQLTLDESESFERFDRAYYFSVEEPDSSQSLWATDLKERWMVDTDLSMLSHTNYEFAESPDVVTFYHRDGQLWRTDATRVGTYPIADGFPLEFENYGDFNVFYMSPTTAIITSRAADGTFSYWLTDGTEQGTQQVVDRSEVNDVVSVPSTREAYFIVASDGERELWKIGGLSASKSLVTTIENVEGLYLEGNLVIAARSVIDTWTGQVDTYTDRIQGTSFSGAGRAWGFESAGGANPTPWRLRLSVPSEPDRFFNIPVEWRDTRIEGELGSRLLISATEIGHPRALWWFDPDTEEFSLELNNQQQRVKPEHLTVFNDRIFYFSEGRAVRSTFEPEGRFEVAPDMPRTAELGRWMKGNVGRRFRIGFRNWSTDGTVDGTHELLDLRSLAVGDEVVTFGWGGPTNSAGEPLLGSGYHAYVPSEVGDGPFYDFGESLVFVTWEQGNQVIWSTDGTTEGTLMVAEADHVEYQSPQFGFLIYVADSALWRTDGTAQGTVKLVDQGVRGFHSTNASVYWRFGEGTDHPIDYFPTSIVDQESNLPVIVWLDSNGYAFGEPLLLNDDHVSWFTTGGRIVFQIAGELHGGPPGGPLEFLTDKKLSSAAATDTFALLTTDDRQVWTTDGTLAGTFQLFENTSVKFGARLSLPGLVFFERDNAIWMSDGTLVGTKAVISGTRFIKNWTGVSDDDSSRIYIEFEWGDGTKAVWVVNASGESEQIIDVGPSDVEFLDETFAGFAFFTVDGHGGYQELWVTNGSSGGTQSMGPFNGAASSWFFGGAYDTRVVNNHIVTIRSNGVFAHELSTAHNYGNPDDTTGDGVVVPRDALVVINELNHRSESQSDGKLNATVRTKYYFDVNQDGYVSPIDAIRVINRLNAENRQKGIAATPSSRTRPSDVTMRRTGFSGDSIGRDIEWEPRPLKSSTVSNHDQRHDLDRVFVDLIFQRSSAHEPQNSYSPIYVE